VRSPFGSRARDTSGDEAGNATAAAVETRTGAVAIGLAGCAVSGDFAVLSTPPVATGSANGSAVSSGVRADDGEVISQ
jgi:hypothetical protein